MKLKLSTQQVQRLFLVPYMQQSIAILMLPIVELSTAIEQELQENPLLEIDEEQLLLQVPTPPALPLENKNISSDTEESSNTFRYDNFLNDETMTERPISKDIPLEDKLLEQLHWEISDPLKLKIGEHIISNLNDDGYLSISLDEIAKALNILDIKLLEDVLSIIHTFEPIGIAARNLKECLILQIKSHTIDNLDLCCRIIQDHLEDLGAKKILTISRKLGVTRNEVEKIVQIICSLEPKPARNHRPLAANTYIKPDVSIIKNPDEGYQIIVSKDGILPVRTNLSYKNMLNNPHLTPEERNYIKEKLKNALQFMKGIEQRGQTIYDITQFILDKQKSFFDGDHLAIVPMTLKDVANAIERNESTICRAINNKYIDTPQGLFPMKFFFSQAVNQNNSSEVSSRGIKEEIKELIEAEDKSAPLSDQDIQNYFERKGMRLARRTVSKYRQGLKILPSHLRKNRIRQLRKNLGFSTSQRIK